MTEPLGRTPVVVVRTGADLRAVARRRPTSVVIAIDGMSHSDQAHWQAVLNRSAASCGCAEGRRGVVLALAAYAGLAAVGTLPASGAMDHVLGAAGAGLAGALLGKLRGLIGARHRFRHSAASLAVRLGG